MNFKRNIAVITLLLLIGSMGLTFGDDLLESIKVSYTVSSTLNYNGEDVTPTVNKMFVYQNSTYVPLREVFELMGKNVDWNAETNEVTVNDPIDAFATASIRYYYEESSLKEDALLEAIKNRDCAISVSTVNPDGTPNAAVVIPEVANEETLMFGLADNQTKVNLMNDKNAVITAYIYSPDAEAKTDRNIGARIKVEYIDDEALIEELMASTEAREGTIFVRIIEILPLG